MLIAEPELREVKPTQSPSIIGTWEEIPDIMSISNLQARMARTRNHPARFANFNCGRTR